MPIHIRTRLAMFVMAAVLVIPIAQGSLRGIDHILTCAEPVETPFQVILNDGVPIVTGSTAIEEGDPLLFCGGLGIEISVGPSSTRDVTVFATLTNESAVDWFGTVELSVGAVRIPIDLGRVPSGSSLSESVELSLDEGITEFGGSLLIGP
ncbi:MAG TPA: hypothetical protein VIW46_13375 [Acidimicrobiia bacterium]